MKRRATSLLALISLGAVACGGRILLETENSASSGSDAGAEWPYAAECANAAVPPATLECTGLYTNLATQKIAPGVVPYAPAVPLWSDGATKRRWIWLPPGTKIDATDPSEWTFPVGTKVWKEFTRDGKRIETRLWQKVQSNYWVRTTYRWNDDESGATTSAGGDFPLSDGGIYHIPTGDECDQCHRGRIDHILGFEQVSLGLAGATGLTLPELVSQGLISPAPSLTHLSIGDDGTGRAAASMAWIHINCGVSCHNDNSNSTAYGASQRLRLDPTLLDGRSSVDFDTRTTTIDQTADTPAWAGQTRIVPGDPTDSLLVKLISNRGTDNPVSNQMPPIASLLVDEPDTQNVESWIRAMPGSHPTDAGMPSSKDGGVDAGMSDAGKAGASADASIEASVDATAGEPPDATTAPPDATTGPPDATTAPPDASAGDDTNGDDGNAGNSDEAGDDSASDDAADGGDDGTTSAAGDDGGDDSATP